MGQKGTKQLQEQGTFLKRETNHPVYFKGDIYLSKSDSREKVMVMHRMFESKKKMEAAVGSLKNTLPCQVPLVGYEDQSSGNMCSTIYKLSGAYKFIEHTLEAEYISRLQNGTGFSEGEVVYVLQTLLQAEEHDPSDLAPQSLLLSSQGLLFTLVSPLLPAQPDLYTNLLSGRPSDKIYISPERLLALKEKTKPTESSFQLGRGKNSMFVIGLIILQLSCMASIMDVYDYSDYSLIQQEMNRLLSVMEGRYTQALCACVYQLLQPNAHQRISPVDMRLYLDRVLSEGGLQSADRITASFFERYDKPVDTNGQENQQVNIIEVKEQEQYLQPVDREQTYVQQQNTEQIQLPQQNREQHYVMQEPQIVEGRDSKEDKVHKLAGQSSNLFMEKNKTIMMTSQHATPVVSTQYGNSFDLQIQQLKERQNRVVSSSQYKYVSEYDKPDQPGVSMYQAPAQQYLQPPFQSPAVEKFSPFPEQPMVYQSTYVAAPGKTTISQDLSARIEAQLRQTQQNLQH